MRKISLKNLNLKEVEQLSREQLKNVLGGSSGWIGDSGTTMPEADCSDGTACETDGTYCGADDRCTCGWVDQSLICTSGFNG